MASMPREFLPGYESVRPRVGRASPRADCRRANVLQLQQRLAVLPARGKTLAPPRTPTFQRFRNSIGPSAAKISATTPSRQLTRGTPQYQRATDRENSKPDTAEQQRKHPPSAR